MWFRKFIVYVSAVSFFVTQGVFMAIADPVFPIRSSANNRHLVDAGGNPFLIHGDTPWAIFYRLSTEDARMYLEKRRTEGYNTMLTILLPHPWHYDWSRYGNPFTSEGDLGTPSDGYFGHVEEILRIGEQNGIQFIINPIWCNAWGDILNNNGTGKVRRYGEYLGNRYKDFPNIIWCSGGDGGSNESIDAVASGIYSKDPTKLQTSHIPDNPLRVSGNSWFTLNNVYVYEPVYHMGYEIYNAQPRLPYFLIESCYEDEHSDWNPPGEAWRARIQAYTILLCGASGHVVGPGPGLYWFEDGWKDRMNTPMYRTMPYLKRFFDSIEWHLLEPDGNPQWNVVKEGRGEDWDFVAAARASDRSFAVVYMPSPRQISVDLGAIIGDSADLVWHNPRSGDSVAVGTFPTEGQRELEPPSSGGEDDWLLHIRTRAPQDPQVSARKGKMLRRPDGNPAVAGETFDLRGRRIDRPADTAAERAAGTTAGAACIELRTLSGTPETRIK
jgi:hypothetical protein